MLLNIFLVEIGLFIVVFGVVFESICIKAIIEYFSYRSAAKRNNLVPIKFHSWLSIKYCLDR